MGIVGARHIDFAAEAEGILVKLAAIFVNLIEFRFADRSEELAEGGVVDEFTQLSGNWSWGDIQCLWVQVALLGVPRYDARSCRQRIQPLADAFAVNQLFNRLADDREGDLLGMGKVIVA